MIINMFEAGKSPKFDLFIPFYEFGFEVSGPFYYALASS